MRLYWLQQACVLEVNWQCCTVSSSMVTVYHHISEQNTRNNCKPYKLYLLYIAYPLGCRNWSEGDKKCSQACFSAKWINRLAKPTNRLASRSAGLGLWSTPEFKPKPEQACWRRRKPILQAKKWSLNMSGTCAIFGRKHTSAQKMWGKSRHLSLWVGGRSARFDGQGMLDSPKILDGAS
jgi:hypothetical protein